MMFGVVDEGDPIPKEAKVDFELEDEIEVLIDEGNNLDDLKKVEEVAIKLRKEEELRLYEEKKQQLKDEAMKAELAAQAAAASEMVLEKQREEMARLLDKLNELMETSKLEAGEVKGNFKDDEKSEPNQQVTAKEPKNQVKDIKKCQGDTIRECHTESSTTSKTRTGRAGRLTSCSASKCPSSTRTSPW